MTLVDLEARLIKSWIASASPGWKRGWSYVDQIDHADGLFFLCPTCFTTNSGRVGTHSILCWSPEAPSDIPPGPGRWNLHGTGLHDLTLKGVTSDSVLLTSGCAAHFFVREGRIEMC